MIIARSNVIGTVPLERCYSDGLIDEVVRRSNAYAESGADVIFVNAMIAQEVAYFAERIQAPLMGMFSAAAPIPIAAFEAVGYQVVIGSICSLYMAARGMIDGLKALKESGDWNAIRDKLITDDEFAAIVRSADYGPLYGRYDIPQQTNGSSRRGPRDGEMKPLRLTAYGAEHVELLDVPLPDIGRQDVLVQVRCAGICGSDVKMTHGEMGAEHGVKPPVTLGHEFAGIVAEVGSDAQGTAPGDPQGRRHRESGCPRELGGAY